MFNTSNVFQNIRMLDRRTSIRYQHVSIEYKSCSLSFLMVHFGFEIYWSTQKIINLKFWHRSLRCIRIMVWEDGLVYYKRIPCQKISSKKRWYCCHRTWNLTLGQMLWSGYADFLEYFPQKLWAVCSKLRSTQNKQGNKLLETGCGSFEKFSQEILKSLEKNHAKELSIVNCRQVIIMVEGINWYCVTIVGQNRLQNRTLS